MSQAMTTRAGYEMAIAKARHRYAKVRADNQLMFAQESQFAWLQQASRPSCRRHGRSGQ